MNDAASLVNNTLTLAQNNEKVFCNWAPEQDKFISYNVYRDGKKLTGKPVYVFDTEKKQQIHLPTRLPQGERSAILIQGWMPSEMKAHNLQVFRLLSNQLLFLHEQ